MAQVCVMGVLCALLSILFCKVMHAAPKLYAKYFPNPLGPGGCWRAPWCCC